MTSDTKKIPEKGVATLPKEVWEEARRRTEIIGPLADLDVVSHQAADTAAEQLGLCRRQIYNLIARARQGTGLVTDLLLPVVQLAVIPMLMMMQFMLMTVLLCYQTILLPTTNL